MKPLQLAGHVRVGNSDRPEPNDGTHWLNDRYQVQIRNPPGSVLTVLSIKPLNGSALHDWRDFQWIKNQLCGDEAEAFEIYPAESRLVDTGNQFWLLVMPPGLKLPFGFVDREVTEVKMTKRNTQRPWPAARRPDDLLDRDALANHNNEWVTGPIVGVNEEGGHVMVIGGEAIDLTPAGEGGTDEA